MESDLDLSELLNECEKLVKTPPKPSIDDEVRQSSSLMQAEEEELDCEFMNALDDDSDIDRKEKARVPIEADAIAPTIFSPPKILWNDIDQKERNEFLSWLDDEKFNDNTKNFENLEVDHKDNVKDEVETTGVEIHPTISDQARTLASVDYETTEIDRLGKMLSGNRSTDLLFIRDEFLKVGSIPHGLRSAAWCKLLKVPCEDSSNLLFSSIYGVEKDLKNQNIIRHESEVLSNILFKSTLACEKLQSKDPTGDDNRLKFTQFVESILTLFCKRLSIEYWRGLCNTFSPVFLLAATDEDEHKYLWPRIFNIIYSLSSNIMKQISMEIPITEVANSRRPLFRLLLLYHDPLLAIHLDLHFPFWINAPLSEKSTTSGKAGVILNEWLSCLPCCHCVDQFCISEKSSIIWDHCLLQSVNLDASSWIMCLLLLSAILSRRSELLVQTGENLKEYFKLSLHLLLEDTVKNTEDPGMTKVLSQMDTIAQMTPFSFSDRIGRLRGRKVKNRTSKSKSLDSSFSKDSAIPGDHYKVLTFHHPMPFFSISVPVSEVVSSVILGRNKASSEKIQYFIIDCRHSSKLTDGKLPTAFHFDPDIMIESKSIDQIMSSLIPLRGKVHLTVMGEGIMYLRDKLNNYNGWKQDNDDVLSDMANDTAMVNDVVLFLTKRGFPFVSVIEGGYAAAHTYLHDSNNSTLFSLNDLADHCSETCGLCNLPQRYSQVSDGWKNQIDKLDSYARVNGNCFKIEHLSEVEPTKIVSKNVQSIFEDGKKWFSSREKKIDSLIQRRSSIVDESKGWLHKKKKAADIKLNLMKEKKEQVYADFSSTASTNSKSFSAEFKRRVSVMNRKTSSNTKNQSTETPGPVIHSTLPENPRDSIFTIDIDSDDDEEDYETAEMQDSFLGNNSVQMDSVIHFSKGAEISQNCFNSFVKEGKQVFQCRKIKSIGFLVPRHMIVLDEYLLVMFSKHDGMNYGVKSCNHLSHILRMTKRKKNKLLVTIYLKYESGQGLQSEKSHSYEIEKRDLFIETVRECMERIV